MIEKLEEIDAGLTRIMDGLEGLANIPEPIAEKLYELNTKLEKFNNLLEKEFVRAEELLQK